MSTGVLALLMLATLMACAPKEPEDNSHLKVSGRELLAERDSLLVERGRYKNYHHFTYGILVEPKSMVGSSL